MYWLIAKYLLYALLGYVVFKMAVLKMTVMKLQNQGVHFISTFPILTDSFKVIYYASRNPGELYLKAWFRSAFGDKKIPAIVGIVIFGMPFLCVNDPKLLEDFYVRQNQHYSKHAMMQAGGTPLFYSNISSMSSDDPNYPARRKVLSTAFLKSKFEMISTVIKEVTLQHIGLTLAGLGVGESKTLDMVKFTRDLQSCIIISILCGKDQHTTKLPCETPEGVVQMPLPEFLNKSLRDLMDRALGNPLVMMFPYFADKGITASERRFINNAATLRRHIEKLIVDRRSGKSQSYHGGDEKDFLDLLINDELYMEQGVGRLIDDIIVMFIAGMETIQMATTNLVQHLTMLPDMKKRLIQETEPVLKLAE
jgi:cytochrome P450